MTLGWIEHPEARDEFLVAHERYLVIEDGKLGDEFADAVESAIELISSGRRRRRRIWVRAVSP